MEKLEKILQESNTKLFIFDFDGTIMDTIACHYSAWCETYRIFGKEFISEEKFKNQFSGTSSEELIETLNQKNSLHLDISRAIFIKNNIFKNKYYEKIKPFPKVIGIIKNYFGKIPFVIASGGEKEDIIRILNKHNLSCYFEYIISINDVKKGKPEPDLFLTAAKKYDVPAWHCLVFEDSEAGFQAAKKANMKFININELCFYGD